jgi:hypothetical protein
MHSRSATANQVKDRRKSLKQNLFQTESGIKNIFKKIICPTVTLNI